DEQRLPSDELPGIGALQFQAGEDLARVIAEADRQPHELLRRRHVLDRPNRAEPDVEALENCSAHRRLDRRRREGVAAHRSRARGGIAASSLPPIAVLPTVMPMIW